MMTETLNSKSNSSILFILRLIASILMVHHGIEKMSDIQGFTTYIVDQYFAFLPLNHALWTTAAAYTQIIGSLFLLLGIATRLSAIGLASTMVFALAFHGLDTGLQGAPFGIVEAHNYEYETSALYLAIFAALAVWGSGLFSISTLFRASLPEKLQPWA